MKNKDGPGRKTILDKKLFGKIQESILDGNDLRKTAKVCGIEENTLYDWTANNYLNLADKIDGWKRDRKLRLAERNIEQFLEMDTSGFVQSKLGPVPIENDPALARIKADMSKFVAETLGRKDYAKKTETDLTSKGDKISTIGAILSGLDANDSESNG